jgi:hypothetical protein
MPDKRVQTDTNSDDYFNAKREFDNTIDGDKLSILSGIFKQTFRECQLKK